MGGNFHPSSFHGSVLRTLESSEIRVTELAYPPGLKTRRHSHEYAYLGIVLRGFSTQMCGNKVRSCRPWAVFYHPPGEVHWDHVHRLGTRELNIEIAPATVERFRPVCRTIDGPLDSAGGRTTCLAAHLYSEMRQPDDLSSMAIEGLAIELLAEIAREGCRCAPAAPLPWLQQARELIEDRFMERLTLFDIAESVGVHPVHLAREFHRHFHRTIGEQIRLLRVESASRMLADGQPLAQVALAAGFSDQSCLSRTFKSLLGTTPGRFRREFLRANPVQKR